MQRTFVDATIHLQLYFAEQLVYCIIIQADFKWTDRSATPMTRLLALLLLVKYVKLSITCLF